MRSHATFTPAAAARALLEAAEVMGLDIVRLRSEARLDGDALDGLATAVSDAALKRFWSAFEDQHPQPTGRTEAGLAVPFGAFGPLDYLVGSATSVGAGFYALKAHLSLASSGLAMTIEPQPYGIWVGIADERVGGDALVEEYVLAVCVGRFRSATEGRFLVRHVELRRPRVSPPDAYRRLLNTEVRFTRRTGLQIDRSTWSQAMNTSDSRLHETMLRLTAQLSTPTSEHASVVHAVRARLGDSLLSGASDAESVARALGQSVRTMQRQLAEAGVTYSDLLDTVRREEALRRLATGASPTELAAALGYADQTSLSRAFRRWTGSSIRSWLRQHDIAT